MEVKEIAAQLNEKVDSIKKDVEERVTKAELTDLQTKLTELAEKGVEKEVIQKEFEKLESILEKQGKQLSKVANIGAAKNNTKEVIQEKLADIDAVYKAGAGKVDLFEQKAVALVTTANATTNVFASQHIINTNQADESNAGSILRGTWIENYASVSRINRAYYSYVDWKPLLGDAAATAEGVAKPQIDFQSVATQVSPTKVAGYIALTEESITDLDELDSVAREILLKKVMLKRQSTILTYITGTVASAYTAGGSLAGTVSNPNLSDVVEAIATQIWTTETYTDDIQMMPNVAFVNPTDYYEMHRTKDANDNYVYPQFAGLGASIPIIPNTYITAGKVLVGDFTKLNIKNYIDYSVRLGWTGTQFIENEFTMVGETRYFAFVKTLDAKAFIYDDISTVLADINKP